MALKKSLCTLGFDEDDVQDVIGDYKDFQNQDISKCPQKITIEIIGILSAAAQPASESVETILKSPVRAIFAYGTLRADYSSKGDKWGVTHGGTCTWTHATVSGFELYQEPNLYYPFATRSDKKDIKLVGTLLQWPSDDKLFAEKLSKCNQIEGWSPNLKHGLYKREVILATPIPTPLKNLPKKKADETNNRPKFKPPPPKPVKAYIYYQVGIGLCLFVGLGMFLLRV
ncbi:hypothetical protein AAMO2058_001599900 [Amorphochlora amoebiformis]